jgi:hypothetical protein
LFKFQLNFIEVNYVINFSIYLFQHSAIVNASHNAKAAGTVYSTENHGIAPTSKFNFKSVNKSNLCYLPNYGLGQGPWNLDFFIKIF